MLKCVEAYRLNGSMRSPHIGVWLNLAERMFWEHEVAGSNPVAPIIRSGRNRRCINCTTRGELLTARLRHADL